MVNVIVIQHSVGKVSFVVKFTRDATANNNYDTGYEDEDEITNERISKQTDVPTNSI